MNCISSLDSDLDNSFEILGVEVNDVSKEKVLEPLLNDAIKEEIIFKLQTGNAR